MNHTKRTILQVRPYSFTSIKSSSPVHKRNPPIYKHITLKKFPKKESILEKKDQTSPNTQVIKKRESDLIKDPNSPKIFLNVKRRSGLSPSKDQDIRNSNSNNVIKIKRPISSTNYKPSPRYKKSFVDDLCLRKNISFFKFSLEAPYLNLKSDINLGDRVKDTDTILVLRQISEKIIDASQKGIYLKFYYNPHDRSFNILPLGPNAPYSECCKSGLVISLSHEHGGKIICPQNNCYIKCLNNFFIDKSVIAKLWPTSSY